MRMLDLFSGLHGASARFQRDPAWEVVSIDNNPDLNPTHCWDLSRPGAILKILDLGKFDLIWASPPCIEFYKCLAPFYPEFYKKQPCMKLVEFALEVVKIMEPDFWVLENTKSGNHFIKEILGDPRQIHGPFYLWGNFIKFDSGLNISESIKTKKDTTSGHPLRSNLKAMIPIEISAGLYDVIMNQPTLEKWL